MSGESDIGQEYAKPDEFFRGESRAGGVLIRLVRWAVSVSLVQGATLVVLAQLVSGFDLNLEPEMAWIALLFTIAQL